MNSTQSPDSAKQAVTELAKLIERTLREFVLNRDALKIEVSSVGSGLWSLRIIPHDSDFGRVLGTRGAHFNALIALCRCVGEKHALKIELKPLAEPARKVQQRYNPFEQRANWPKDRLLSIISDAVLACVRDVEAVTVDCHDHKADSDILVGTSSEENKSTIELLDSALYILGNSIGKPNGRTLTVKVERCNAPTLEPQPETADGRFTKEVATPGRAR
jgi:predicted RNA-binding protein YlqC (UPF0109 family)